METKILNVFLAEDMEDGEIIEQQVWSDECKQVDFRVHNLDECPEDAIIKRDLFSAGEYLDAVRLGMSLAQQGYTGIKIARWKDT